MNGNRVTFSSSEGHGHLVGLENLNLQRIAQVIANNPGRLLWDVSGTVTEYRGANFIAIEHAILESTGQD
ncbi:MAG: hypothetical protein ACYTG0_45670 [Planctomycetota bacterium]|jgi:hypothetical protein